MLMEAQTLTKARSKVKEKLLNNHAEQWLWPLDSGGAEVQCWLWLCFTEWHRASHLLPSVSPLPKPVPGTGVSLPCVCKTLHEIVPGLCQWPWAQLDLGAAGGCGCPVPSSPWWTEWVMQCSSHPPPAQLAPATIQVYCMLMSPWAAVSPSPPPGLEPSTKLQPRTERLANRQREINLSGKIAGLWRFKLQQEAVQVHFRSPGLVLH